MYYNILEQSCQEEIFNSLSSSCDNSISHKLLSVKPFKNNFFWQDF
nr:MAG TPA: hypothetical protein [Caudoviricetes sp.]DAX78484.1 MAG TPA: hypothetical protein [Caudoviricetes sp.]